VTIGIFGTGRFGSFWASTLREYATVVTYSRTERPAPHGCTAATLEELGKADCVMLCVAIHAVGDATAQLAPHLGAETVLMDTCSVKVFPVEKMLEAAPQRTEIIGTHPMFGPDSASAGVVGLPFVYSPVRCGEENANRYRDLFSKMGMQIVDRSPEEHDREAAMTQGVTHFIGRVLAELDLEPSQIATKGYQKLLEVMEQTCNDPYELFIDLQRLNPYTSHMRRRLRESISRIANTLDASLDTGSPPP
jgi:prephenate dehydrogenase